MVIRIERGRKKRKRAKKKKPGIGFTNKYAVFVLLFLAIGLAGGFILALFSIKYQYTGALMCWTVVFTPIGTAVSIVPHFVVHKSTVENSGADGEGIKFAAAKAHNFIENTLEGGEDSPAI